MSKYRIGVSEAELLSDLRPASQKDNLMKKLDEIDKKYLTGRQFEDELPESLGLEKMRDTPKSGEELRREAEDSLEAEFAASVRKLGEEYAKKRAETESRRTEAQAAADERLDSLADNYEGAKKSLSADALSRGLARSSVVVGELGALERDRAGAAEEIARAKERELAGLDAAARELSAAYEQARVEKQTDYARGLEKAVSALAAAQEKRAAEVLSFNNAVSEKEAKYQLQRSDRIADRLKEALKDPEGLNARRELEKAQLLRDFLDDMPKEAALAFLKSDEDVKQAAGRYYDYLYQYTKLR